jgi:hypothetical protein
MLLVLRNLFEDTVQTDLASIARNPLPFGSEDDDVVTPLTSRDIPPGVPALTITYDLITSADPIQSRFIALTNSLSQFRILLTGFTSTQLVQGHQIRDYGGATYDSKEVGDDGFYWIYVYYDVSDCGGSHYHGFDSKGQQILLPRLSILYHELSHAYHEAIGDEPIGSNPADTEALKEAQAINDENKARAMLGAPLRDPNNHGGSCGFSGHIKTFWDSVCFVATAASGSQSAPSVLELLRFRDGFLRRTELGRTFFDELFAEYYQFSPALADDLRADPSSRATVSRLCVEPLIAMLRWTKLLCAIEGDDESLQDLADSIISSIDQSLREFVLSGDDVAAWARATRWLHLVMDPSQETQTVSGGEGPEGDPWSCVRSIIDRALKPGIALPVTRWAIAWPIRIYWDWMLTRARGKTPQVVGDLVGWVGTLPVAPAFIKRTRLERKCDLETLKSGFIRNPEIQERLRASLELIDA